MTDLSPGQEVTVSGMHGGAAEVVYVRGGNVRVRMLSTHCPRTVPLSRVTPKRESKALSVEPPSAIAKMLKREADAQRAVDAYGKDGRALRPVPKPVTLRSEPYLAYVRKHPCCFCGNGPSEAHHWSHHGGVMGAKVDDYRTVPLCTKHHRYWHDHGTLPGHDRVGSEWLLRRVQRELLVEWSVAALRDGAVVDALIRAIGGADA